MCSPLVATLRNEFLLHVELGNPRGNENPFLLTFGILWFRYHNVIAQRIADHTNITDDEKLFNEARKWVIATHQVCNHTDLHTEHKRQDRSSLFHIEGP